jgi:hypothetical protein
MAEKRGYKRFVARGMGIDCWIRPANKVTLIDLCMSGISLQGDMRFEIGRQYAIKLECEDKVLSVKGAVIWSILSSKSERFPGDFAPVYRAGVKFIATPPDNLQGLIDMIGSRKQSYSKLDSAHKVGKQMPVSKKFHNDSAQKESTDVKVAGFDKRIHLLLDY